MSAAPAFANSPELLASEGATRLPEPLEREIRRIYERSPLYGKRFPLHAEPIH